MQTKILKGLSLACNAAAAVSLIGSVALYVTGRITHNRHMENDGLFVGLWVPSFFILSDRLELAALEAEEQAAIGQPAGVVMIEEFDMVEPQSPHPMSNVQSRSI